MAVSARVVVGVVAYALVDRIAGRMQKVKVVRGADPTVDRGHQWARSMAAKLRQHVDVSKDGSDGGRSATVAAEGFLVTTTRETRMPNRLLRGALMLPHCERSFDRARSGFGSVPPTYG
jgi:hypothetical protein